MSAWKAFAKDAQSLTGRGGRRCGVGLLLDALAPKDAAVVRRALSNRALSAAAIRKALEPRASAGTIPSAWTIGNHRRGVCRCDR